MSNERILVVDDERLVRWSLRRKLEEWDYSVIEAETGTGATGQIRTEHPDLVLLDIHLPDINGMQVLEELKDAGHTSPVIMITANPQLDDVKTALKLGAYDFISKPLDFDELRVTIGNALETSHLRTEVGTLREEIKKRWGSKEVIGESAKMKELIAFSCKIAASEASTLLILGESGTGKDLIAKTLHDQSRRADKSFVAINCSAIPEMLMESELFGHERGAFTDAKTQKKGLFEIADGGTLFLDEIGELTMFLQAKLLRVLEDQTFRRVGGVTDLKVNVRVIAASNRDLEQAVREGSFRQDLFYRLSVIPIFIPPLRQRREDIVPLAEFFIARYNERFRKSIQGLSPEAARLLETYEWPGNVRELRNAIERAMILEETQLIQPTFLPLPVRGGTPGPVFAQPGAPFEVSAARPGPDSGSRDLGNGRRLPPLSLPSEGTSLEEVEREFVRQALEQTEGNQTRAAKLLDISRDALRYKMKKFGFVTEIEAPGNPT